jgi:hypothetical protein
VDQFYHIFHSTNQCPTAAEAVISVAEALQNVRLQSARNTAPLETSTKTLGERAEGGQMTPPQKPGPIHYPSARRRRRKKVLLGSCFCYQLLAIWTTTPLSINAYFAQRSQSRRGPEPDGVVVAWAGRRRLIDNQRVACASSSSVISSYGRENMTSSSSPFIRCVRSLYSTLFLARPSLICRVSRTLYRPFVLILIPFVFSVRPK